MCMEYIAVDALTFLGGGPKIRRPRLEGASPSIPSISSMAAATTSFRNGFFETARFLRPPRSLQLQRCCRWTVFVLNFYWSQSLSNGGHQDNP